MITRSHTIQKVRRVTTFDLIKETTNKTDNYFVIAVDALSTSPFVNINKDKNITGLLLNDITLEESFLLENSFDKFEKFIHSNSKKIINSLFVYALHPLNHDIPTFFIHIYPSSNGKGNNYTTDMLHNLAHKCKEHNLNIIGFSSDGDNSMSKYHTQNINLFEKSIFDITENYLYFSDVLHLIKRGRYHFVKKLHKLNDKFSKIDELRILFNLPFEIFRNESYTKMHESLAVRLFTAKNIILLYNNSLTDELIYFLPFVSLNEVISNRKITLYERIYLLNIIKYFCQHLRSNNKIRLNQKYLIKPNILTDLLSTAYSFEHLLLNFFGEIDLNRCSTAPLEHNFGISRMSCRDNNRMERLLLQFARIDVRRLKKDFLFNRTMNHRVTNHGAIVKLSEFDHSFDMPDNEIIEALIPFLNSKKVSGVSYSIKNMIEIFDKIEEKLVPSSRFICKSSDVFVNPSTVTRIQSRLENDLGKRCKWSVKEEELLIKLSKDMGSNCTKLSKYFDERTPKAVFQKATQFYKNKKIDTKPFLK